jgi:GT2 family glycosyltransferase
MQKIAVLLTCFNRKEKTLEALSHMFKAFESIKNTISIKVYLTDDGSTDGTGEAVCAKYPEIKVLQGNGALYWAGGMRNSWNEALKSNYDGYFLLNDDTMVYSTVFAELIETHHYTLKNYNEGGIYIGSTIDSKSKKLTYGGCVFTNKFLAQYIRLSPNKKTPQKCELGNANIMLVSKNVVDKIGILHKKFAHGLADFDYTLMATKKKLPVLITPNILGDCTFDHSDPFETLHLLSFKERKKKLYHPTGLDFKSNLQFMKRNFIYRLPIVFIFGWVKILFPKFYYHRLYKTRLPSK